MNNPLAPAQSDEERIRRIAEGDEKALEEIYASYGQRLYAYALRITRDPASAEEAVQECLLALWRGAIGFRGESRVIVWLLGILHHKALNQLRGRETLPLIEDAPEIADSEPAPDAAAESREERRLLRAGLDCLSAEHRTVLELVFYQGLTINEAAEVCQCPPGTVKSRLNYAKSSLRGVLHRAGLTGRSRIDEQL